MHILQPKHIKLNEEETQKILAELNIAKSQLPKILSNDAALVDLGCEIGDLIKIERKEGDQVNIYYRVVV